ncbi:hypothetical protein BD410DRAFT_525032 [Rickenella mellea]|uniref:Uncharacterized protein n=1 Tax=Rickenella mellea TaxID=50990 RepID=A0A4Y7QFW2_9AGAM|nr:hypothetical protein BD410DRAFT_525032 [Rickenella mellea]
MVPTKIPVVRKCSMCHTPMTTFRKRLILLNHQNLVPRTSICMDSLSHRAIFEDDAVIDCSYEILREEPLLAFCPKCYCTQRKRAIILTTFCVVDLSRIYLNLLITSNIFSGIAFGGLKKEFRPAHSHRFLVPANANHVDQNKLVTACGARVFAI